MRLRFAKRRNVIRFYVDEALAELEKSNAIRGVEIFATGTHNGRTFTEDDIDEIIRAFNELDFRPALKIGHTHPKRGHSEIGMPSYGWVTNLTKKVENIAGVRTVKLLADFEDMHDSVVTAIRNKLYDRVSAEIYMNLERGKRFFRRALKAVALLGAEIPAVAGLKPLHRIEFSSDRAAVFAFEVEELDVPLQASIASLEARAAGIETFLKENPKMKLRLKSRVTRLKAKLAEFNADIEKLRKKGTKDDDEEMKRLKKCAQDLEEAITELGEDDQSARVKELENTVAELTSEKRQSEVERRVARCRLVSARPHLAALVAHALENAEEQVEVVIFDDKGKPKKEKKTLVACIEEFIDQINDKSKKLFDTLAVPGAKDDETENEDPGVELDNKVTTLMDEKPDQWKSYSATQAHVLKTNPELKRRYEAHMTGDNQAKARRFAH